jgi:hypothetical protein
MTFNLLVKEVILEAVRYDIDIRKAIMDLVISEFKDNPRMADEFVTKETVEDVVEHTLDKVDFADLFRNMGGVDSDEVERMIDSALDNLTVEISR